MPFPQTRVALEANGYSFLQSKACEACDGKIIEMWKTPKGNLMPLDFKLNDNGQEVCEPHFATCKDPARYSRRLREKQEKQKDAPIADA